MNPLTTGLRVVVGLLFAASAVTAVQVGRNAGSDVEATGPLVTLGPSLTTTTAAPVSPVTVPPAPNLPPAPITEATDVRVVVTRKGIVAPVLRREGDGWRVRTPCGKEAVVTGAAEISGAAVVLDPGHGGSEPGAKSPDGLAESHVNMAVVREAKEMLELQGYAVVLTRTADYRITLEVRAEIVKALRPKAFVSVHHNAEPDGPSEKPGSETYYQWASADSKRLSGLIYEEAVSALSVYDIDWVADTDAGAKFRRNDRGDDYYGILRRTQGVPAVLAELGFISNPPEAELMRRPDFHSIEGDAVARGIIRFLTTPDPGSGYVAGYTRTSPAGSGGGSSGCVDPALG